MRMARVEPGLAFSLICDLGFAVGLVTHQIPRIGDLVWVAEPIFDEEPDLDVVLGITDWRWPILFPAGAALRRKIIAPIGIADIPPKLKSIPLMRSGSKKLGWREARVFEDGSSKPLGPTTDPSLPIFRIVNDTRLREMLVAGWKPERDW
jgi:hypothetical protein